MLVTYESRLLGLQDWPKKLPKRAFLFKNLLMLR